MFATEFESLPRLFDQRSDYRILINSGTIVDAYSVIGQQTPDQSIDILRVDSAKESSAYEARAVAELGEECARWLANGTGPIS